MTIYHFRRPSSSHQLLSSPKYHYCKLNHLVWSPASTLPLHAGSRGIPITHPPVASCSDYSPGHTHPLSPDHSPGRLSARPDHSPGRPVITASMMYERGRRGSSTAQRRGCGACDGPARGMPSVRRLLSPGNDAKRVTSSGHPRRGARGEPRGVRVTTGRLSSRQLPSQSRISIFYFLF